VLNTFAGCTTKYSTALKRAGIQLVASKSRIATNERFSAEMFLAPVWYVPFDDNNPVSLLGD
jgi:hypothetical protein